MRKISTTPQYLNVNEQFVLIPAENLPDASLTNEDATANRFNSTSKFFRLVRVDGLKIYYLVFFCGKFVGYLTLSNTDANGSSTTRRTSIPPKFQEQLNKIMSQHGEKPYIALGETATYLTENGIDYVVNGWSYSLITQKECEKSKTAVRETSRNINSEDAHNIEQNDTFCYNRKENAILFSRNLLDAMLLKVFKNDIVKPFVDKTFEPVYRMGMSLYVEQRKHTLLYQGKDTAFLDEIPLEIVWFFKIHLHERLTKGRFNTFVKRTCPTYQKSYEETIENLNGIMNIQKIKNNYVVISEYMSKEDSTLIDDNPYQLSKETSKKVNKGYVNEALTIEHFTNTSSEKLNEYFDLDADGETVVKAYGRETLLSSVTGKNIFTKVDAIIETTSVLKRIQIKIDDGKPSYAHSTNVEDFIKCFKYLYGNDIINRSVEKALYLLFGAKGTSYEPLVVENKTIVNSIKPNEYYLTTNQLREIDVGLYVEIQEWLNLHSSKILKYILLQGNICDDNLMPDWILYSNFYVGNRYGYLITKEQILNYCYQNRIENANVTKRTKYTTIDFSWGKVESKDGRMMFHFDHKKWLRLSGEEMKVIDFFGDAMQEIA